eukprot:TRINITY_DN18658_c0_g1_i5.p1 TRINITY_DN18658_c0_g1~~TRINITY_DN18658_c0_g1_i5.p1  ORF type:complete len:2009 (+),score=455.64 TRINITY_DN18658_c0_g1_i5:53-6028(+)
MTAAGGRCAAVAAALSSHLVPRMKVNCGADVAEMTGSGWINCLPEWPPLFDVPDRLDMLPAAAIGALVPSRTPATDGGWTQGLSKAWLDEWLRIAADVQNITKEFHRQADRTYGDNWKRYLYGDPVLLRAIESPADWGCSQQLAARGAQYGAALRCGRWCALLPACSSSGAEGRSAGGLSIFDLPGYTGYPAGIAATPAPTPAPTVVAAADVCGDFVTSAIALRWTENEYWAVTCGGADPCCTINGPCLESPGYQTRAASDQWCWAYPKLYDTDVVVKPWHHGGGTLTEWRGQIDTALAMGTPHFTKVKSSAAAPTRFASRFATDFHTIDWLLLEWRAKPGSAPRWRMCLETQNGDGAVCAAQPKGVTADSSARVAPSPAVASMALSGVPLPPQPPAPPPPPPPPRAEPVPGEGGRPLLYSFTDWAGTKWGHDGAACGRVDPLTSATVSLSAWCATRRSGRVEGCWGKKGSIELPNLVRAARNVTLYSSEGYGFAAVSGGRLLSWFGTLTEAVPAAAGAVRGISAISPGVASYAVLTGDGRVAASWGTAVYGGELPMRIRQLRGVAAVACNAGAFAALLADGTIGGAWGVPDEGGALPAALQCAVKVAAISAAYFSFAALHSNGTIAGSWGKVAGTPLLDGVAAVVGGFQNFVALSSSGRVAATWGDRGRGGLPGGVTAARNVSAVIPVAAGFALQLSSGLFGGLWVMQGIINLWVPPTGGGAALAAGSTTALVAVGADGQARWISAGARPHKPPPGQLRRLAAAPVVAVAGAWWSETMVALRGSGSVAAAWWVRGDDAMQLLPDDEGARHRLLGERCAPPDPVPGTDVEGCVCTPPGWSCTVRRRPWWRALRPTREEWDDDEASSVAIRCPENNTGHLAPMRRLSGAVYSGVSLEPYNCSGGPQAGADDRVLSYASCNEMHSGDYCAPRCAEGWAAVNATAGSGASFLLRCMPHLTLEGEGGVHAVNGYDASGVRCVRLLNASELRVTARPAFEAIGLPLRPALAFEAVSSSGAVLPSPPPADCFLCDCSLANASLANASLAPLVRPDGAADELNRTLAANAANGNCGECELLHNATAEYDPGFRGSCELVASGIAPGGDYPVLVAVVAFRRPLLERDKGAFGHLPDLVHPVEPGAACLPSQVLILAPGDSRCAACPAHLVCDGSNSTGTRKGWWRPDKLTLNASKCATPHCAGAAAGAPEPRCSAGSGGPLCGSCVGTHRIAAGACRPCGETWAAALLTVFGAFAVVALMLIYLFVNATVWLETTDFRDILQIILSHLQFLSLLPYFLGPIYGAAMNALLGGLKAAMAPLAGAAPLLCLLSPRVGQVEMAWAAVVVLWTVPVLAGLLAAAALPPLLRRRLEWRLRRAAADGKGRIAGAECARCGNHGSSAVCGCGVLAVCPCGAEWATRWCVYCGSHWVCEGCAAPCAVAHPGALDSRMLRRTGPMQPPRRTLFWLGVNLMTNYLLPHSVSVIAAGFQHTTYDERAAAGWLRRRAVLSVDNRITYEAGGPTYTAFIVLMGAAVAPMLGVYWRLKRIAPRDGLGSAHAVLAYGVFYAPYRRVYYLWGLVSLSLKVAAAGASTLIAAPTNRAVFGVMLHSVQCVAERLADPELDSSLTWATQGTVLVTVAGGQWLLLGGTAVDAVLVRVLITVINLWCFWKLFRALRAAAPPLSARRCCPCAAVVGAVAAASPRGSPAQRQPAPSSARAPQEPAPGSPLRRLLRTLPRRELPAAAHALCRLAEPAPPRRQRTLRAAAVALLRGACSAAGRARAPPPAPATQSPGSDTLGCTLPAGSRPPLAVGGACAAPEAEEVSSPEDRELLAPAEPAAQPPHAARTPPPQQLQPGRPACTLPPMLLQPQRAPPGGRTPPPQLLQPPRRPAAASLAAKEGLGPPARGAPGLAQHQMQRGGAGAREPLAAQRARTQQLLAPAGPASLSLGPAAVPRRPPQDVAPPLPDVEPEGLDECPLVWVPDSEVRDGGRNFEDFPVAD